MKPQKLDLLVMSFDGDSQRERIQTNSIDDVWEYSNDMGSKWFFYPYHFVVTNKTIKNAPEPLDFLQGKRISTVKKIFAKYSAMHECQDMGVDHYAWAIASWYNK